MSVRYRREHKPPDNFKEMMLDGSGRYSPQDTAGEIITITERYCACSCGARWWADADTETRCPYPYRHPPHHRLKFMVPA